MMTSYAFEIQGMMCVNGCAKRIEEHLKSLSGIDACRIDFLARTLTVESNTPALLPSDICAAVQRLGFGCQPINSSMETPSSSKTVLDSLGSHWALGALGIGFGLFLLLAPWLIGVFSFGVLWPLAIASSVLTLFLGKDTYRNAWNDLRRADVSMDTLFALSTAIILVVSIAALFYPTLPVMLDAGLMIFGFRHLGIAWRESMLGKVRLNKTYADSVPDSIIRLNDGLEESVSLADVKVDDVILIHPEGIIPVDGILLESTALLDVKAIWGSRAWRSLKPGEVVLGGMILKSEQPMRMKVSRVFGDSSLACKDKLIAKKQLAAVQGQWEKEAARLMRYFIPLIIISAVLSGVLVAHFFTMALAIQCAVAVLVSACPCTLGIVTPISLKFGMHKAAEHGVLIDNPVTLETLRAVNTTVIDCRGTLTEGEPIIDSFSMTPNTTLTKDDLFRYFKSLETPSKHPVGRAIANSDVMQNVLVYDLQNWTAHRNGVSATIDGALWQCGNADFLAEQGISVGTVSNEYDLVTYLVREKSVVGQLNFIEPLRQDAIKTVDGLRQKGHTIYICTGENQIKATHYAMKLGIPSTHVQGGATPQDKAQFVKRLREEGRVVMMVGDSANDALAIAASNVGIAIRSSLGCEVLQDRANVVIQNGSLLPVLTAVVVAEQTIRNIKQNLLFSFAYNAVMMLLASGLLLVAGLSVHPAVGVGLMMFQSALIFLNAYRFKQRELIHFSAVDPLVSLPSSGLLSRRASCHTVPTPACFFSQRMSSNAIEIDTTKSPASLTAYNTIKA